MARLWIVPDLQSWQLINWKGWTIVFLVIKSHWQWTHSFCNYVWGEDTFLRNFGGWCPTCDRHHSPLEGKVTSWKIGSTFTANGPVCVLLLQDLEWKVNLRGKVVFTIIGDKKHLNSVKVPIVPIDNRKDSVFTLASKWYLHVLCAYFPDLCFEFNLRFVVPNWRWVLWFRMAMRLCDAAFGLSHCRCYGWWWWHALERAASKFMTFPGIVIYHKRKLNCMHRKAVAPPCNGHKIVSQNTLDIWVHFRSNIL